MRYHHQNMGACQDQDMEVDHRPNHHPKSPMKYVSQSSRSLNYSSPSRYSNESLVGYMHKGFRQSNNDNYVRFLFQTSATKIEKAISYDGRKRSILSASCESGSALKLRNITIKDFPSTSALCNIVLNERSIILSPEKAEVDFERLKPEDVELLPIASVAEQDSDQYHIIEGYLQLSQREPQEQAIRDGILKVMLTENRLCDMEENWTHITLWEDHIDAVKDFVEADVHWLRFYDVKCKTFNGNSYVTTTARTVIEQMLNAPSDVPPSSSEVPDVPAEFPNFEVVVVDRVKLVSDYSQYWCCQFCYRKLTEIATIKLQKCEKCGSYQDVDDCISIVNAKIKVNPADQWLTVFDDELKKISQNVNNMERLFADILSARKLELTIDRSRNIIVGIKFQAAEEFDGNKELRRLKFGREQ